MVCACGNVTDIISDKSQIMIELKNNEPNLQSFSFTLSTNHPDCKVTSLKIEVLDKSGRDILYMTTAIKVLYPKDLTLATNISMTNNLSVGVFEVVATA